MSPQEQYNELAYYTLAHPDQKFFIHQYVVDAFAAQNATEEGKPIGLAFALIGLYLHIEKNYTGKQVQQAHMDLAKSRQQKGKVWPRFKLPKERGEITAGDVLAVPPGEDRDEMIKKWSASVWEAYKEIRQQVIDLLMEENYNSNKYE